MPINLLMHAHALLWAVYIRYSEGVKLVWSMYRWLHAHGAVNSVITLLHSMASQEVTWGIKQAVETSKLTP